LDGISNLPKLVEKQPKEYNKEILKSRAIFTDFDCPTAASGICLPFKDKRREIITGLGAIACVWIASPCRGIQFAMRLVWSWAATSDAFYTWLGNTLRGQETTVKQLGCGAACEMICLACPSWNLACIMCGPACEQVCNQIF